MTPTSRLDAMIEELHDYLGWLEVETERVKAALTALEPANATQPQAKQRAGSTPRSESKPTSEMLVTLFQDNPSLELTAPQAVDRLKAEGWTTDSQDPVNAVRAALARLSERGELERARTGTYRLHAVTIGEMQERSSQAPAQGELDDDGAYLDEPPF